MIKAALFPISIETLPLVKYINKYYSEYQITSLLSFPGSGLCGKDAGYADNRWQTGIVVSESLHETRDMWDVIFVAEQPDPNNEANIYELTIEALKNALELDKHVICCTHLLHNDLNIIKEMAVSRKCSFTYLPDAEIVSFPKRSSGVLFQPLSYVIFVGGLIREANSFEVFLSIVGKLQNEYNVLSLSTNVNCMLCKMKSLSQFIYSKNYSESEKIYAINDYVRILSEMKPPDIIIVHIAEPMMEYNERIPNGLGILPYMISKALVPDYFICGIPYGYGHSEYISAVSEGILYRFGYEIDYVHLSNAELDTSVMNDEQKISVSYTLYETVDGQIKQFCVNSDSNIRVSNVLNEDGLVDLHTSIINELSKYDRIISIIS